jgi:hypothetical protein
MHACRRSSVVLVVCLSYAFALPSLFAWGRTGHQIVAIVAARGLSPAAAAQVATLLGGKSLADVSALPDTWRSTQPETAGWHFVNVPKDDTAYDETRDCPPQNSEVGRNCAVAAIEHFKTVVADRTASKQARGRALTFLVHFVGDIHQPLHSADNNDRGGNNITVTWFGQATHKLGTKDVAWNLHAVWDEGFIEHTGLTVDGYADQLLAGGVPPNATSGTTVDWVNDAYALAKSNAYVIPAGDPAPLDEPYFATNLPVVDKQLLLAGLRLRSVLEAALGAGAKAPGVPAQPVHPGPGTPGSSSTLGCGDSLWQHVYNPQRLLVKQDCITVTGTIVDATANQTKHRADGMRHEPDGDTHGWLKVDPQFASLLNAGNGHEGGNLVFELICHYSVSQPDAKPACVGFKDTTVIPPVGTHVAIRGTFVQDKDHQKWNEIHPVSAITVP